MTPSGNHMPTRSQNQDSFRHDLRTHISAILSLVELIKKNPGDQPNTHLLNALHLAADNALALMDDGIHKAIAPVEKAIDIDQLLEDFALLAQGLVLSCQAQFKLDLKETVRQSPTLEVDPVQLHRVLMLLLDNALHYAAGSELTLTADRKDATSLSLIFSDTGPGFGDDNPDLLFQPYHRGTNQHHLHGSGLGLWSARNIISAMGGSITARNAQPHGAVFEITLPTHTTTNQTSKSQSTILTEQTSAPLPQVLVVDDNKTNHLIMGEILTALGYECHHALSGATTMTMLPSLSPALILIDIRMPDMDGWDLARLLRQKPELAPIPLIAISSDQRPRKIHYFADWLQRPIRPTDMAKLLDRVLETNKA